MRQGSATKARRTVKSPQSTGPEKPWESFGISRASWYRRRRLAGAQLDVARPGSGDKPVSGGLFDYGGLTRRQIAELILFRITTGEIPATPARVSAAKEIIRISRKGSDQQPGVDAEPWTDILASRS
jgi:hypothetical protein